MRFASTCIDFLRSNSKSAVSRVSGGNHIGSFNDPETPPGGWLQSRAVTSAAARATAFGHPGAGGSIGLGDIENDLAIAFIPNLRRDWLARDRRAYRLVEAVYAAL
ncbi:hypothetical protein OHB26_01805 [Nocardia sp. NBC_01503]|uniref:hypothetical protein n=1 Tax=Nocardia sp. NBC_01503 TaxID=2975997 RepID=UPI002E7AC3E9|nr:hypothetical protein [Nocardia sp. NBC_01503]WTL33018.1 hypothetical protein OHB26_01805 [Nocardia sp. NBC_01503]